MCGIFGVWNTKRAPLEFASLPDALRSIRHRGPDDEGYLLLDTETGNAEACSGPDSRPDLPLPRIEQKFDARFDLAFGFRRLSILDLSPAGHQPMGTADGSLWVVLNGEIYNYIELRAELRAKGYVFRSQTDTEVVLNAYREWGMDCLQRFNGMWGFAIFDLKKRRLFCARDRFGIKPFYYIFDRERFVFGSEIKALLTYAKIERKPNDPLVYDYLAYGHLDHTDETFFQNVRQLPAAHFLLLEGNELNIRRYWDIDPSQKLSPGAEAVNQFSELFEDAVRIHLRSDVTIGSCLSGGLDSSSIVCVANKLLFADHVVPAELIGAQQKTFSSCFEDPRFDERKHIEEILTVTSAESNYTFPTAQGLMEDLPHLIWHQDEPFGSTSIYAQWRVMKLAAERGVRVMLDGQGGDELLAGYHPYFDTYWGTLLGTGRLSLLLNEWSAYHRLYGASPMRLLQHTLFAVTPDSIRRAVRAKRSAPGIHPEFAAQFRQRHPQENTAFTGNRFAKRLHQEISRTNLPGLLHYEDRNSMAHSIEARVPFLDYRLVEFAFSLPDEEKIRDGSTKAVLRNSMKGVLPEKIRTRTDKMGFVTPERVWLSTELKGWLEDTVQSASFKSREYFDHPQVERLVRLHQSGEKDLGFSLWRWLNLELWMRQMIDPPQFNERAGI
jgi:asparagine synthase (glutamine-hydrolysing)